MSEKTQVRIVVYLNEQYGGRPDRLAPCVREFLQELCDMGAEQMFSLNHNPSMVVVELESGGDGSIVITESRTFADLVRTYECGVPPSNLANGVIELLVRRHGNFVRTEVRKALEELKKPEIVQVETGITYEGYPVVLQFDGNRDRAAHAQQLTRAEEMARSIRDSTVDGFKSSWAFGESPEAIIIKPRITMLARVMDLDTLYYTGVCCGGFSVHLRASSSSTCVNSCCRQMREDLGHSIDVFRKWGLISD